MCATQAGEMLPLGTLVSYTPTETAPLISHFNIFRSAEIDGGSGAGYSSRQTTGCTERRCRQSFTTGICL